MADHVVVGVEIQKTIEETPGGWDATDKLGVAVACVWEYAGQRMKVYGPEDVDALRNRLLRADRISGYNILNFDFPVIWGFSKAAWSAAKRDLGASKGAPAILKQLLPKTDDMLRRIWTALGFNPDEFTKGMGGCKLDDIAEATLGVKKIGNGADAPRWYQAGLVQKVVNYCADDVVIERDLTDFVDDNGYVLRGTEKLKIARWAPGGK